jgi:hypothetical protein
MVYRCGRRSSPSCEPLGDPTRPLVFALLRVVLLTHSKPSVAVSQGARALYAR